MKTRVFLEKFKGYPMFTVWAVNDAGEKIDAYPLFSMGGKKSIALYNHLEDFKAFAKDAVITEESKAK